MSKNNYNGKRGFFQMKEEYYDYSCYQDYKKYWIEKNFPKRFRKHKKKIFEIDTTEYDEIKNKKREE